MAKAIPNQGDTNWAIPLNQHLGNLITGSTGGINFSATIPTGKNSGDEGYTYINTTTRELIRWDGANWIVLLGGLTKGKEKLTAIRSYYINSGSLGNDSNTGLSAATPFKTIQKAIDTIKYTLDQNGFRCYIVLANSTTPYSGALIEDLSNIEIQGNKDDTTQVIIDTDRVTEQTRERQTLMDDRIYAIKVTGNSNDILIYGVTLSPISNLNKTFMSLLWCTNNASCTIKFVEFGGRTTGLMTEQMRSDTGGIIRIGSFLIVSGAATRFMAAVNNGKIYYKYYYNPEVVNNNGSAYFAVGSFTTNIFAYAERNSFIEIDGSLALGVPVGRTAGTWTVTKSYEINTASVMIGFPPGTGGTTDPSSAKY
jgi:hypothetical protein